MRLLKKYRVKIFLLAFMLITFVMQVSAQEFTDDGGPGDFDPPPDNDVPLDTYQWVFLGIAIAYGVYTYIKHNKANSNKGNGQENNPLPQHSTPIKTKIYERVFDVSQSFISCLSRLFIGTGPREENDEALLRVHYQQEKPLDEKSCINDQRVKTIQPYYQKNYMLTKLFHHWANRRYRKAICCLLALAILTVANAHDGPQTVVPTKVVAPVSVYYQWFMFGVAAVYTVFLFVRARKRKAKGRTPEL